MASLPSVFYPSHDAAEHVMEWFDSASETVQKWTRPLAQSVKERKSRHTFEQRCQESQRVRSKFPNLVPTIVCRANAQLPLFDKQQFLAPVDLAVSQFLYVLRKRTKLSPDEAIFLYARESNSSVSNSTTEKANDAAPGNPFLPAAALLMGELDAKCRDADGYLYLEVSKESTFGVE
jgi:GABA(A) receptor-associated protein